MKWTIPVAISVALFFVTCFIVNVHTTAIVNGQPSGLNEFPFMAALGWVNNETGKADYLCGGVLVSAYFVLTAAHCLFFDGRLPDIIQIGGNHLNSTQNEIQKVQAHYIYPEYNATQAYNDIALLKLKQNSWKQRALFFPKSIETSEVTAIGYGTTQFAGVKTDILQKVELTIMAEQDCKRYFKRKRKFKSGISPSHICAGDPENKRDTCQGDSGGPLLLYSVYVVGITSVGQACSGIPPAIYTRVSFFLGWIQQIIATQFP